MKLARRQFLRLSGAALAAPALSRIAVGQGYPARPVRIVVGNAPGGGPDIAARLLGPWLSDRLGQPVIVENRPGAGGNLATETVVNSPADGHTLLLITSSNAVNETLYQKLSFKFLRDIAPVASISREAILMVVHPSVPAKTIPEFIVYAKANPGKVSFASSGTGTTPHVAGELFKLMAGVDMVHVPYRGAGPAITDLLGGQVPVAFAGVSNAAEYVRASRLHALAVTTATRSEALPDVPTISEFIKGFEASQWYGVGAPRNTPVEIIDKLNKEINAGLADPKIKARLADLGSNALINSPADFAKLIVEDADKWGKLIRAANLKPE